MSGEYIAWCPFCARYVEANFAGNWLYDHIRSPTSSALCSGSGAMVGPAPRSRIKPPETSVLPEDIGEVIFNASRRDEGTISALGAITLAKALLAHFKIENLPRG